MNVKGITNSFYPVSAGQKKSTKVQNEDAPKSDKFEISSEARVLQTKGSDNVKDLSAVQQKIDDKYYDRPEVIAQTADAILKEITKQ